MEPSMAGNKQDLWTGSQELSASREGELKHQLKHGTGSAQRSQGSRSQQCASLGPPEMFPVPLQVTPTRGVSSRRWGALDLAFIQQNTSSISCKPASPSCHYSSTGNSVHLRHKTPTVSPLKAKHTHFWSA